MTKTRAGLMLGLTLTGSSAIASGANGSELKIVWPKFAADSTCTPVIENGTLHLGVRADVKASGQMKAMYDADQADREGKIDWNKVTPRDVVRRKGTMLLLESGKLSTGKDLIGAAFIFQHGNCPNDFLLAHTLAAQSLKLGNTEAKFIFAATYDRWLVSSGKPQKYGTQMPGLRVNSDAKGKITSCEVIEIPNDPTTKDSERLAYGLPTLAQREKNAENLRQDYAKQCPDVKIKDSK